MYESNAVLWRGLSEGKSGVTKAHGLLIKH